VWIKGGVDRHRGAALVARPGPARSHNAIVINADRDRLGITESARWGMASGAGVIVVQAGDRVEPEQSTEVCLGRAYWPAELLLESRFDLAREASLLQENV